MAEQIVISKISLDIVIELLKDQINFVVKGGVYFDDDEYAKDRVNDLQTAQRELIRYRKQNYGKKYFSL